MRYRVTVENEVVSDLEDTNDLLEEIIEDLAAFVDGASWKFEREEEE